MNEIKDKKISIKCTKSEREIIEKYASENNMSLSEFIRQRLLGDNFKRNDSTAEKILKSLSVCTAFAQVFVEKKFSDEEFKNYEEELVRILDKNGINDETRGDD